MNLSDSFTLMSLFTIEPANCVSRSLVVKGLKMFICKHAWASTTDVYLTHEAVLPTTWRCLSILWGVSGTGRGIRLKNVLGDFDFLGMGTAVGLPWWKYEYKVNNFRHREARSQWGAKYKSQGDVFRHSDRDLLCFGASALEDSPNNLSYLKNEVKGDWTWNSMWNQFPTRPLAETWPWPSISGVIQYLFFSIWAISLNRMHSRFIHVIACTITSFLFKAE